MNKIDKLTTGTDVAKFLAYGFGTAAKLAAKGFSGAIIGGAKLTFKVIIPSAIKGVSEVVEWSKHTD